MKTIQCLVLSALALMLIAGGPVPEQRRAASEVQQTAAKPLPFKILHKRVAVQRPAEGRSVPLTHHIYKIDWMQVTGSIVVPLVVAFIGYRAATRNRSGSPQQLAVAVE